APRGESTIKKRRVAALNFIVDTYPLSVSQRYLEHENVQQDLPWHSVELFENIFDVLKFLRCSVDDQRIGRWVSDDAQLLFRFGCGSAGSTRCRCSRSGTRRQRSKPRRHGNSGSRLWHRRSGLASGSRNLCRGVCTERLLRAKTATPKARSSRGPRPAPAKLASAAKPTCTTGSRAMKVLQASPLTATRWGGQTQSRTQDVGQFFGLTIFYGIDKNSSSRAFCDHVNAVQPSLRISPSRLTVADHHELVDSWQSEELRGKTLRLWYGGGIGLHDFCHLGGKFFSARHLGLVEFHPRAGKDLDINKVGDFHQPLNIRGQVHDDKEISPRIFDDLTTRHHKWRKDLLHFPDSEEAHGHNL